MYQSHVRTLVAVMYSEGIPALGSGSCRDRFTADAWQRLSGAWRDGVHCFPVRTTDNGLSTAQDMDVSTEV